MTLDRRRFLGIPPAVAGALLGSRVGAAKLLAPQSGDGPRGRGVIVGKCLKFGMVDVEGSIEERFRLLRELGFDGVELDSPTDLDLDEVAAASAATGLAIPGLIDSVHWSKPLSDPDPQVRAAGRRGLETALRDAARLGASTVLLVPGIVNESVSYDQAYERSQAELRTVLPLAEELGVQIAIENVWNGFLLSPLEAARYLDELESEAVGWYFDVGNIVTYGFPEQWIRILGSRLVKLDIKEFSRRKRDAEGYWKGFDVALGEGDCQWPRVLEALEDIGFRGWASAEVRGGDRERLAEISARMDRILEL